MRLQRLPVVLSLTVLLVSAVGSMSPVRAQSTPRTLVIGVDHVDPANQRPDQARVFAYTDFFSREVSVHSGDALDFRFAPGSFHVIGLSKSEPSARAAYPVVFPDPDHVAVGTGMPKLQLGPSNGPIKGGTIFGGGQVGGPVDSPTCGLTALGQPECTFTSDIDVEDSGGIAAINPQTGEPVAIDWVIRITAPEDDYSYFCYIHPGMRGTFHVVGRAEMATTQADIDKTSETQFQTDQRLALEAERIYNVDKPTTEGSVVTHHINVGVSAANNRVAIDEMLPQRVNVGQGDQVEFKWRDPHEVHTVGIAQAETQLPQPFLFDCGTTVIAPPNPQMKGGGFCFEAGDTVPELIADPGNALSGVILRNPQAIVNSGALAGSGYFVMPSTQTWSVRTDRNTASGTYQFWCSLHGWMNGSLAIGQL